jgi:hypothetical protein
MTLHKKDSKGAFGKPRMPGIKLDKRRILALDFPAAIKAVIEGKRITRIDWKDKNVYGHRLDERLMIRTKDGQNHPWIISDGDLLSTDWEIVT